MAVLAGCSGSSEDAADEPVGINTAAASVVCDADDAGISLPAGFCAVTVADLTMDGAPAPARHLVVVPGGNIFVAVNSPRNVQPSFGIIGLRDIDGDGRADEQARFSPGLGGSGLAWSNGFLYFGVNDRVLRFTLGAGMLTPSRPADVVVSGLPNTGDHISKTVVIKDQRTLWVNVGSASNACQEQNRHLESPGIYPCPELPIRAGVWQFDAQRLGQTQADGHHYATGLRNMVALAVQPRTGQLFGVQHGRDMLFENWPDDFTVEEDAVLPAEELVRITDGSDNGWPYCYYDAVFEHAKVLAPEYGGDGHVTSGGPGVDCASYNQPLVTFGAHWAPNGIHFYTGKQFPARYRGGAFVAFHGGFDRAPLPNEGYQVAFVPFGTNGLPAGTWETFANGFAGSDGPLPATALHRPVGVTEGPDGSLYVSDDRGGRIYRILYTGG
jgi:glucose/arabinose dehydrogenase